MILNNIKTTKCPICGCEEVIGEFVDTFGYTKADGTQHREIRRHCNGGRNEKRRFLCGTTIEYCPNFQKEEIKGECVFSKEYKEKIQKEKEDKEKICNFIKENEISEAVVRSVCW